ncbi:MAG TPA: hypothetical protein VF160_11060 [Candidatus Dormibacteraeota bacterium]
MISLLAAFISTEADPDFWWHLRIGQWMLQHGLPRTDIFTYTVPDHAWTDHEYLTEIGMAWIQGWGGLVAISLAFGLLTWAGLWLLFLSARAQRAPYVIAGLGLALGALAGEPIWGPRAQMITFFMACLELHWLRQYLAGRSRVLYWFPLVMVLWANLHGGWVIAFAFLGVAMAAEALRFLVDRQDLAARAHLRRLVIITAASGLAVLATPHGPSLLLYPFQTQGSVAQQSLIVEWFSPNFHRTDLKALEAMIFLVFLGFILRRPSPYDLLLAVTVVALSLQSVRHIVLFVAATTPILITTWSGIWHDVSERRGWRFEPGPPRPFLSAVTGLALLVMAVATVAVVTSRLAQQDQVTRSAFPVGAADWLAAHPEVGTRMFNSYGYGGYLAYRFYPDPNRRVYVFGEAELMGDPLLLRYQAVASLGSDWASILDQDRVDYVVFDRGQALPDVLATEPGWDRVYQDAYTEIYVRR